MDRVLHYRAERILSRIGPFLPPQGTVLDIGCGTGHNAAAIRARYASVEVLEADVVDMKVTGPPPVLLDGKELPFGDGQFECGLALFVLHYSADPVALLCEARRVISRRLIVLQSTYEGWYSLMILRCRETVQGRGAFHLARRAGLIRPCRCSLRPRAFLNTGQLESLFKLSGWSVRCRLPQYRLMTRVSRDLYVLEKGDA
jgi:SAM-dependent methyltransferase